MNRKKRKLNHGQVSEKARGDMSSGERVSLRYKEESSILSKVKDMALITIKASR